MLAPAYAIASRLAYVLFVGIALRRQERIGGGDFRRFRRIAAFLMYNDAAAFIVLCIVTRDTLAPTPRGAAIALGIALAVIGLGTKVWAARTLGADAYYWHNFFVPPPPGAARPARTGPYRFAANPMYTIGYLQTYGFALLLDSWPGLLASAFAQAAILAFYFLVEKPHFDRLHS